MAARRNVRSKSRSRSVPARYLTFEPFKTGLEGWLEHHGLRVPDEFVLQLYNANDIPVPRVVPELGNMQVNGPIPNWFWPIIGLDEAYDRDNPAVQQLKSVDLYWPHPVDVLDNRLDGKKATVLVRSHAAESWRWKVSPAGVLS